MAMQSDTHVLDTVLRLPEWEALPDFGLYMDQVIALIERALKDVLPEGEITKSMVNNYVKVRLIPRPAGKKYEREHLAMLLMICILKQALTMEEIAGILSMLCARGIGEGYMQFISEVEVLREAMSSGQVDLWQGDADACSRALRAGVTAAICTIFAREIIKEAQREKI